MQCSTEMRRNVWRKLFSSPAWCWQAPPGFPSPVWLYPLISSCQVCAHTPNPNSPPNKNRRITSICTTHAPLQENKALFVLYYSFTLSALSGFCLSHTITPPSLSSFFLHVLEKCVSLFHHSWHARCNEQQNIKDGLHESGHEGMRKVKRDKIGLWKCFVFLNSAWRRFLL